MIVVSDTSPLRYLAVLGELEVLPKLFGAVFCPRGVVKECLNHSAPESLRTWASDLPDWLKVADVGSLHEAVLDLSGRRSKKTHRSMPR